MEVRVSGCSSPSTRRDFSRASRKYGSASLSLPWACSRTPRLLMEVSVSGCSSPSTRRRVARADSCSGNAASYRPIVLYRSANAWRRLASVAGSALNCSSIVLIAGFRIVRSIIAAAVSVALTRTSSCRSASARVVRPVSGTPAFSSAVGEPLAHVGQEVHARLGVSICASIWDLEVGDLLELVGRRLFSAFSAFSAAIARSSARVLCVASLFLASSAASRWRDRLRACHIVPARPAASDEDRRRRRHQHAIAADELRARYVCDSGG